jgi:hypothetical protein
VDDFALFTDNESEFWEYTVGLKQAVLAQVVCSPAGKELHKTSGDQ